MTEGFPKEKREAERRKKRKGKNPGDVECIGACCLRGLREAVV